MKRLIVSSALMGLLLGLGPAIGDAQPARSGAGPVVEEERVTQMMKMMGEMREQMHGMREQMHGMREQMRTMMEQHRGHMSHACSPAGSHQPHGQPK